MITKYVVGRSGIIGFQLHRENFSIGFSYDFPVVKANVGNLNAFEIGIELRKLVDVRLRKKAVAKKKSTTAPSAVAKKTIPPKPVQKNVSTASDTSVHPKPVANLKTTLQHKQDSALASAEAGNLQHQPLIIEKITLHFNFEFNSSELDDASLEYLDDLSTVLNENEHLKINLTGHTDNVGSAKFNQRLSIYRASTIKDYLTGKGISPDRIQTEGKGLTEPLNQNKTEEERARNRRVSLVILYED
jgi:outer membrane protein OmpA-like peptidoglycan-associated protein